LNDIIYKYHYKDKDHIYTLPNGILKNKLGITNQDKLDNAEIYYVTLRIAELRNNPIQIKNSSSLLDIHQHLFQDLYDWAGKLRRVETGKDGIQFSLSSEFRERFLYINSLLKDYRIIDSHNKNQLSHKLAKI